MAAVKPLEVPRWPHSVLRDPPSSLGWDSGEASGALALGAEFKTLPKKLWGKSTVNKHHRFN